MTELVVILGVLVILSLWIAGHTIYRWRTDVLSGRYVSDNDPEPAIAVERTDDGSDPAAEEDAEAEEQRTMYALLLGWNLDEAEPKAQGESQVNPEAAPEAPPTAAPTK
jgi:hypothetical protein